MVGVALESEYNKPHMYNASPTQPCTAISACAIALAHGQGWPRILVAAAPPPKGRQLRGKAQPRGMRNEDFFQAGAARRIRPRVFFLRVSGSWLWCANYRAFFAQAARILGREAPGAVPHAGHAGRVFGAQF